MTWGVGNEGQESASCDTGGAHLFCSYSFRCQRCGVSDETVPRGERRYASSGVLFTVPAAVFDALREHALPRLAPLPRTELPELDSIPTKPAGAER